VAQESSWVDPLSIEEVETWLLARELRLENCRKALVTIKLTEVNLSTVQSNQQPHARVVHTEQDIDS